MFGVELFLIRLEKGGRAEVKIDLQGESERVADMRQKLELGEGPTPERVGVEPGIAVKIRTGGMPRIVKLEL